MSSLDSEQCFPSPTGLWPLSISVPLQEKSFNRIRVAQRFDCYIGACSLIDLSVIHCRASPHLILLTQETERTMPCPMEPVEHVLKTAAAHGNVEVVQFLLDRFGDEWTESDQ